MKTFPLEILPMGTRWPWYPRYTGTATMGEPTTNEHGETIMGLTIVGKIAHGRIGLRRWIKIKAKQAKAKIRGR